MKRRVFIIFVGGSPGVWIDWPDPPELIPSQVLDRYAKHYGFPRHILSWAIVPQIEMPEEWVA